MKKIILFLMVALASAMLPSASNAQSKNALTVPSCSVANIWTAGKPAILTVDTNGVLCTSGSGGGGGGTSSDFGSAFPTAGTAIGLTDGTNMIALPGTAADGAKVVEKNSAAILTAINNPATFASQYPATAVPITASATGTTGATTATLTNVSGHTTYICGYSIRANATAATTVTDTVTGVITATMSSILWVAPLASGLGVDEQIFSPCIPASAVSTSIAVVSGAPGSGGTVSVKAWGYSL